MEARRQKLAERAHALPPDSTKPTFGQPGSSRPSAAVTRNNTVEIVDSDDENEDGGFQPQETYLPPTGVLRPPLAPSQAGITVPYADGKIPPHAPGVKARAAPAGAARAVSASANPSVITGSAAPDSEQFTIDTRVEYEERTTSDEAQTAMRDLLSGAIGAIDISNVDMKDAVVDGFDDNFRLMPHQIQGRAWMAERETGKKTGGILADMGLGKTIQTLARIVDGKPSKEDMKQSGFSKTTLIVGPVSLLAQWAEEIERMTKGLSVIRHHGSNRTSSPEVLKRADVVITTYDVLRSEHKVYNGLTAKSKAQLAKQNDDGSASDDSLLGASLPKKRAPKRAPRAKTKLCALFEVKFWRVVLDEAQSIKNRTSKTAQSSFDLNSKNRWVLTGTPIQNKVEELYSLFRFLRIRPLNDWDTFKTVILNPVKEGRSKNAMKRLHVVLNATMLRRTKNQEIDGKPIIRLPPRTVEQISCEFDAEERAFYESLEARTNVTMNKFMKEKNMISMLILLLRLRQACDHPALLSDDLKKDLHAIQSKPAQEHGSDDEEEKEVDELAGLMDDLGLAKTKPATCNICLSELPKGWEYAQCEACDDTVGVVSRRKSLATQSKKHPRRVIESGSDGEDSNLPPSSTKIRKMLQVLDDIYARTQGKRDEDGNKIPPEKTIIFSQFTTMLDVVEPFLLDAGIRFTRFDGQMSAPARAESLDKIRNDKRCRVILISFKAGGVGLNLTACNHVMLLDLWWNPALEDQAFDRAHRLGQTKEVRIYKFTVTNSVEDRILALQEQKRALAAAALSGGKLGKSGLSLEEVMKLFKHQPRDDDDEDEEA